MLSHDKYQTIELQERWSPDNAELFICQAHVVKDTLHGNQCHVFITLGKHIDAWL